VKSPSVLDHLNLANAITSLSICASIAAIFLVIEERVHAALVVGAITLPCDVLDGVVARRFKTTGSFGAQLDSLTDAIAFGVVPAVIGYAAGVRGTLALIPAAYVLSAVWRLALFYEAGLHKDKRGRQSFSGMPTTFAAALLYALAPLSLRLPESGRLPLLILLYLVAAVLMNFPFSFPKTGWHTRAMWVLVPLSLATLLFSSW